MVYIQAIESRLSGFSSSLSGYLGTQNRKISFEISYHKKVGGMIRFLASNGYTVLNMIEIRKPYKDEKLTTTIHVEKEIFDY